MRSQLTIREMPPEVLGDNEDQARIVEKLSPLSLYVARGPKGWGGAAIPALVGAPSSSEKETILLSVLTTFEQDTL